MVEIVTCKHKEIVNSGLPGSYMETGECSNCHQIVQYDHHGPKILAIVTKLGRIDGKIVIPRLAYRLLLSHEELVELEGINNAAGEDPAATKIAPVDEPEEEKVLKTHTDQDVPEKPKSTKQLRAYYEENKEAILKDYYEMKLTKFFQRWHISTITWGGLKKEWEVKPKGQPERRQRQITLRKPPAPDATWSLILPHWSDAWPATVQEKYLDVLLELAKLNSKARD